MTQEDLRKIVENWSTSHHATLVLVLYTANLRAWVQTRVGVSLV